MMDISLIAKLKKYDDFMACYKSGDESKKFRGKSLLFYSLSNTDTESRYLISSFLLNQGAAANETNGCRENLLHILLSRVTHDLPQTEDLCKRLIDGGADINQLDERGRVPLQYLINMKYTDEELEPLYKIWLAQSTLLVNHKNVWGKTPLDIAEQMPYRKSFVERLKKYE
jgi:ankyrin repeat protein